VVVCGSIGTGKSSVAAELALRTGGVVIASDRVRKHLAGLEPAEPRGKATEEASWGTGLYREEARAAVYRALLERAEPVLASRRLVILDATYASRRWRGELRRWAEIHRLDPFLVEVTCLLELARARLAERAARGRDPSDAGPELVEPSAARFEPPEEWPEARRARIDTSAVDWPRQVAELAQQLPGYVTPGHSGRDALSQRVVH
jgi:hypothetical protein